MANRKLLQPEDCLLMIIDIQEKFLPVIDDIESVINQSCFMTQVAKLFDIPIIATEQNPSALGGTAPQLAELLGDNRALEKFTFSCWRNEEIRDQLRRQNRSTILIAGIETPVCILQTGLDLLDAGFDVYLCVDAISARKPLDHKVALERLTNAGAIVGTVETAAFELLKTAESPKFKPLLGLIKQWQKK